MGVWYQTFPCITLGDVIFLKLERVKAASAVDSTRLTRLDSKHRSPESWLHWVMRAGRYNSSSCPKHKCFLWRTEFIKHWRSAQHACWRWYEQQCRHLISSGPNTIWFLWRTELIKRPHYPHHPRLLLLNWLACFCVENRRWHTRHETRATMKQLCPKHICFV
jgi:hypothetical protein